MNKTEDDELNEEELTDAEMRALSEGQWTSAKCYLGC